MAFKKEDIKKEDIKKEDIKKEDIKKEDIKKEDIKKEDKEEDCYKIPPSDPGFEMDERQIPESRSDYPDLPFSMFEGVSLAPSDLPLRPLDPVESRMYAAMDRSFAKELEFHRRQALNSQSYVSNNAQYGGTDQRGRKRSAPSESLQQAVHASVDASRDPRRRLLVSQSNVTNDAQDDGSDQRGLKRSAPSESLQQAVETSVDASRNLRRRLDDSGTSRTNDIQQEGAFKQRLKLNPPSKPPRQDDRPQGHQQPRPRTETIENSNTQEESNSGRGLRPRVQKDYHIPDDKGERTRRKRRNQ